MDTDRPALEDEIEVTEAMLEAGMPHFEAYPSVGDPWSALRELYVAMERAR